MGQPFPNCGRHGTLEIGVEDTLIQIHLNGLNRRPLEKRRVIYEYVDLAEFPYLFNQTVRLRLGRDIGSNGNNFAPSFRRFGDHRFRHRGGFCS